MAGYVIIMHHQITDEAIFAWFLEHVGTTIEGHGGRLLVRGGKIEVFDGDLQPERCAVIEFDSVEQAREWLNSPRHSELSKVRAHSAITSVMLVQGV